MKALGLYKSNWVNSEKIRFSSSPCKLFDPSRQQALFAMQFSTILITLAVAFSPALAAPTAEPAAGEPTVAALEKRAVGVFVCTGQ